jgi:glycine dehydrogenase
MPLRLEHPDRFVDRHLGPSPEEQEAMLKVLGVPTLEALVAETVPQSIRLAQALALPEAASESQLLAELAALADKNQRWKCYLGMGYAGCITPAVIKRNVLENPGWYTAYTPYQAEIAQGRLEALLNFQQMVMDLTAMPVANASLLDEATAAAEAMGMCLALAPDLEDGARHVFVVDSHCHPQTIAVVQTRALPLDVEVLVTDAFAHQPDRRTMGVLVQVPDTIGRVKSVKALADSVHAAGGKLVVAADILGLTLVTPPGEQGADMVVGSTQRFGVPMGYGGPHAAYFATRTDYVRKLPGRLIGVSEDAHGKPALRMALATREQHIRREKATSNICTAQVLLAVMASMYAVYHGPRGLAGIAEKVHRLAAVLAAGLRARKLTLVGDAFFDTVGVRADRAVLDGVMARAAERKINLRRFAPDVLTIALDETHSRADVDELLGLFGAGPGVAQLAATASPALPEAERRKSAFLTHPVFSSHQSETEMLRYMRRLESRDLSLVHSMIPLGSCTMKLNATAEMLPISYPGFADLHPFVPVDQAGGYGELLCKLTGWLAEVTGFAGVSLQPNAGSQGEYAGLLVIHAYLASIGQGHRDVCLIPASAHGTNPASAAMAGLKVVVVACDDKGNVDMADLDAKTREHKDRLAALMITYPSTHGVFEEDVKRACALVHEHGGQVYMDGANMNAQVGLCRPGDIGADVCHLNLHKTFCIPHGGGGPGMGPIGVARHLVPFLPGHPVVPSGGDKAIGPVSAAPYGSASILPISWAYIRMMGPDGLKRATEVAILSANYIARKLHPHYPVFYTGAKGRVAHECILDMRHFKKSAGIEVEDIAKRLMDYGFHAPTMSFPIASTMMIEPTESEPKDELDRFCDAMIAIREEIRAIEEGKVPREGNVLKRAPHTAESLTVAEWPHPYTREQAAYPLHWVRARKFWPAVGRLNNTLGDRKLVCSCPPIEDYA